MTTPPHDPFSPGGPPQGGWSAPPQGAPNAPAQGGWSAPPQGGWSPPAQPAQGGWSAPPQGAPNAPAQGGWAPPAQPAQGGWSAPSQGAPNAPAQGGWAPPQPAQAGWAPPQPAQGGWAPPQPAQGGWAPPQPAQGGWSQPAAAYNPPARFSDGDPKALSPFDFYFSPPQGLEGTPRLVYNALTVASLPLLIGSFLAFYMFKARYRRWGVTTFFAVYSHFLGTAIPYSLLFYLGESLGVTGHFVAVPLTVVAWIPLAARYALPMLVKA